MASFQVYPSSDKHLRMISQLLFSFGSGLIPNAWACSFLPTHWSREDNISSIQVFQAPGNHRILNKLFSYSPHYFLPTIFDSHPEIFQKLHCHVKIPAFSLQIFYHNGLGSWSLFSVRSAHIWFKGSKCIIRQFKARFYILCRVHFIITLVSLFREQYYDNVLDISKLIRHFLGNFFATELQNLTIN